jgi:ABC-type multidrug transport system ATPase subunit
MAQHKTINLDQISFENVSFQIEGLDPVLKGVDIKLPMDQTVIVQSRNPVHAVNLLEILAGRKEPQSGRVRWTDDLESEEALQKIPFFDFVSSYFESSRPDPDIIVNKLLLKSGAGPDVVHEAIEHFGLHDILKTKFRALKYETQKLVLLVISTLKVPQMLVLEDPAVGISEETFLTFLDWVQYWQRQGHLRHVFMTNNHPTAARHFASTSLIVDEGFIYLEQPEALKKIVHF